jgi:hypothetical protein
MNLDMQYYWGKEQGCSLQAWAPSKLSRTHLPLPPASWYQDAGPDEGVQTHAVPHSSEHPIHLEGVIWLQPASNTSNQDGRTMSTPGHKTD